MEFNALDEAKQMQCAIVSYGLDEAHRLDVVHREAHGRDVYVVL